MATNTREMPHNADAEASVIGGMIMNPENLLTADELLRADDFYDPRNREIYAVMVDLQQEGQPIDLVTLTERLNNTGVMEKIGGAVYLSELVQQVPMLSNFRHYCLIVREQSRLRALVTTANEILDDCYGEFDNVADVIDEAERKIFRVGEDDRSGDFSDIRDAVRETIQYIEEIQRHRGELTGIGTGFNEVDFRTSGLQDSDLIYIAARPSMGKTAFALNIVQHAAIVENKSVAVFSLEMSEMQLVQRLLCSEALVNLSKVRNGEIDEEEWRLLVNATMRLNQTQLHIDDTGGQTLQDIRSKSRKLKAQKGLDLIVIDYLQLMSGGGRYTENRQNEVSEISRGLKALARELDCPIICLSQLSRAPDGRPDHHPLLSDLRESGSIEQDADIVMFLYREYYYDKENGNPNMAELDIAKQRNGPTGRLKLTWRPEYTRFMDWVGEDGDTSGAALPPAY